MDIAANMRIAPTQKRQSRCILLQYGPGSGSLLSPLYPSKLCLLPVISSPLLQHIRYEAQALLPLIASGAMVDE
jgi:hypothetical protein